LFLSACDAFEYDLGSGTCTYYPHIRLKGERPFDFATKTTSSVDVWVLHCSTSSENILDGNDFFRHELAKFSWTVMKNGALAPSAWMLTQPNGKQHSEAPIGLAGYAYIIQADSQVTSQFEDNL
jgi:hypothetical protein